jgi:hypothetical protein
MMASAAAIREIPKPDAAHGAAGIAQMTPISQAECAFVGHLN